MGVWLILLDNVVFFISNGVDIADLHQFRAYTDQFNIGPFTIDYRKVNISKIEDLQLTCPTISRQASLGRGLCQLLTGHRAL